MTWETMEGEPSRVDVCLCVSACRRARASMCVLVCACVLDV